MQQMFIAVAIPKMAYAANMWYLPIYQLDGKERRTGSVGVTRQLGFTMGIPWVQFSNTIPLPINTVTVAGEGMTLYMFGYSVIPKILNFYTADHTVKKQLRQYPTSALRVQDLAFNVDGSGLTVGMRDIPTIRLINELTQSRARQAMFMSGNSTQLYNLIASWVCFSCSDCLAAGQRIAS